MLSKFKYLILFIAAFAIWYFLSRVPAANSNSAAVIRDCPGCNVVVVLIDTLRADHLPFYGYKRDTAPFLNEIAAKSMKFERAFSASSWTAPATASVFTSMMPSSHGVTTGFAATKHMRNRKDNIELNRIPDDLKTLGQFMKDSGYITIGVADNLNIGKEMGFDRGFDFFKKYNDKGAPLVNETAREFLKAAGTEKPFFLYLHYMDPHAPYRKRQPWYKECLSHGVSSPEGRMVCAYDSEISYLDSHIADLFREFAFMNNSVIFFLSDHGEEFYDHGNTGHGKTLYTEMIHVPFTVYHPKRSPGTAGFNIHTFDLLPTIAGMMESPKLSQWQGIDVLSPDEVKEKRLIFSERLRNKDSLKDWWLRSVIRDKWHLINTENLSGLQKQELFDLDSDYKELNNLAEKEKEITSNLTKDLGPLDMSKARNDMSQVELDKELFDQLKSLGYVN